MLMLKILVLSLLVRIGVNIVRLDGLCRINWRVIVNNIENLVDSVNKSKKRIDGLKRLIRQAEYNKGFTICSDSGAAGMGFCNKDGSYQLVQNFLSMLINALEKEIQPSIDTLNTLSDLVGGKHDN